MPFLTVSDIKQSLEIESTEYDVTLAVVLGSLELYLKHKGLLFNIPDQDSTIRLNPDPEYLTSVFETPYIFELTSLKLKEYQSDFEKVLVLDQDFVVSRHILGPIFQIRLLNTDICLDHHLEVTGKFGFGETVPADIKQAILEICLMATNTKDTSGREISSSRIGNVQVSFNPTSSVTDLESFKNLQTVLKAYET